MSRDSLKVRRTLSAGGREYGYFSLPAAGDALDAGAGAVARLPYALKVLLENLLRHEDGETASPADAEALAARREGHEIAFRPGRVLMQDFTGVPALVDLAAMRDAMAALGKDPARIDPRVPVDLVVDHSVQVDRFGAADAFAENVRMEMARNRERYAFLRWGQRAFDNFRVVPPGAGICHQVNLERLARVVWTDDAAEGAVAYPDTLIGTDSHTTMVNGLSVLGWGTGGIEAEAAMLGRPLSMTVPEVIGVRLSGALPEGATATDLVLLLTAMLRAEGVVGKFVEYCGPGLDSLPLADRATVANMAPEYGATCGFFPIDAETLRYLRFTGRDENLCALVEAYARAQGLWRDAGSPELDYSKTLALDLATVEPSVAGPRRPQDRVALGSVRAGFEAELRTRHGRAAGEPRRAAVAGADWELADGAVAIAAITSCTNTSNPGAMIAAGLLARNARARGLAVKPWVKTSLAPGSKAVTDYLAKAGLDRDLEALGFHLVGYGCTTCIGNSGPLPEPVERAIAEGGLAVAAVLSGNRNFEGRIHQRVRANYLASPPLVVAYALAGSMLTDLSADPLGTAPDGRAVRLRDIWPPAREIADTVARAVSPEMFDRAYGDAFEGDAEWRAIPAPRDGAYDWPDSTYVRKPPYFAGMTPEPAGASAITGARALALLGDSVTTDHISPAGAIPRGGPAAGWLEARGVAPADFNSFGARRGNHETMMRGAFANVRLRNELAPGTEGGWTRIDGAGEPVAIYDAAQTYAARGTPLVIVAGREYGAGSSRDWAAKGPMLLGVRAVIAESYERIHRSNLIGMGVLPLQFRPGATRRDLRLDGSETLSFPGLERGVRPRTDIACRIDRADGTSDAATLLCRIDTDDEAAQFAHGGILPYVLRRLAA